MDQPKFERMLRLMRMLSGNVTYSIDELADRLEMSERTIYRYIDTFKAAGFAVEKLYGNIYRLTSLNDDTLDLSKLVYFSDEEAAIVNNMIDGLDNTNALKAGLKIRKGKKITVVKKFFPGYVLVQLNLYDKRHDFLEPTWRFIRETAGVLGFIGGDKPEPLAKTEVDAILHRVEETDSKTIKPKVQYEPGETVKIIDGPFMSFSGTVDEVDPEHGKMKVSVAIFGRSAPVELEYWQVERFTEETPMPEEESPTPEV